MCKLASIEETKNYAFRFGVKSCKTFVIFMLLLCKSYQISDVFVNILPRNNDDHAACTYRRRTP